MTYKDPQPTFQHIPESLYRDPHLCYFLVVEEKQWEKVRECLSGYHPETRTMNSQVWNIAEGYAATKNH